MRKYYKPRNVRLRNISTRLDTDVSPWSLLRAYVVSSAGLFSLDDLSDLIACCEAQSVERYLEISDRLNSYAQSYTGKESVEQVFAHRQASSLLKKYPFQRSETKTDTRKTAVSKLHECERICKSTNERLKHNASISRPMRLAKERMNTVLGNLTPSRIMKMICDGSHGAGSTVSSTGNRVSPYYKYADLSYTVSESSRLYAYAAISSDPKWIDYLESSGHRTELPPNGSPRFQKELMLLKDVVDEVNSDKITFVPKDCRTDRPIAVGAGLNIFLQLGVKTELELCLKRVGIDLRDQTKNQKLAFLGSKFNVHSDGTCNKKQFSTIDLASASDTISIEICRYLLPPDWFAFLSDLRHESGILDDGTILHYEKFSAMGNGFTFPLESLIFYCICYGALEHGNFNRTSNDISVYGDDIIVRFEAASAVTDSLEEAGFSVNTEKSFISGPFKESCGCDYFLGTPVRPFYLKREVKTYEDIYFVCNQLNSKAVDYDYDTRFTQLYETVLSAIPRHRRSYGPSETWDNALSKYVPNITSSYLAVTLHAMTRLNIRPFLSREELTALVKARMYDDSNLYQGYFHISSHYAATLYKAKQSVNYMIALRKLALGDAGDCQYTNHESTEGVPTNKTTRRNAVKLVTRVTHSHHWDGNIKETLYRNLFETLIQVPSSIS